MNLNNKIMIIILFFSFLISQKSLSYYYPVDTLLFKNDLSCIQNKSISIIRKWQTISYKNPNLNCQFYPSCSNFCAINIYNKGFLKGLVLGTDRYLRCNKYAMYKHKIYTDDYILSEDKRLMDSFIQIKKNKSKKMFYGMTLSIIPGLGKIYYGHYFDGLQSFKYTSPFILSGVYFYDKEDFLLSTILGSIGVLFWISDFYGVYNIANQNK